MTQRHKRVIVNVRVVGSIFIFKVKLFVIYKYFYFFGNKAKNGGYFRYSGRNVSKIRRNGEPCTLILGSLSRIDIDKETKTNRQSAAVILPFIM